MKIPGRSGILIPEALTASFFKQLDARASDTTLLSSLRRSHFDLNVDYYRANLRPDTLHDPICDHDMTYLFTNIRLGLYGAFQSAWSWV